MITLFTSVVNLITDIVYVVVDPQHQDRLTEGRHETMTDVMTDKKAAAAASRAYKRKHRKQFMKTLFSRKIVLVAAIIVLLMIIMAVFADQIVPYDPNKISIRERTQGPSAAHWLGTDEFGRDVLSRIIVGSQVSLVVGVLAVIIACIIGTAFGMIAGYFGGVVDDVINRISEAIRVIPQVVLAIALVRGVRRRYPEHVHYLGYLEHDHLRAYDAQRGYVHQGTRLHHGWQSCRATAPSG